MISRLSGILLEVDPPHVVVDVHGVGYEVESPNSVIATLPMVGEPLVLLTHFQVTQDNQTLYGFSSAAERSLFRKLLKISGIGAKMALNILSGASGEELARYVADGDTASLTRVPGIGKKTAERIIIELRDKLDDLPMAATFSGAAGSGSQSAEGEAAGALRSLGYKPAEAARMIADVVEDGMPAEDIIRKALQQAAAT